jgi:hypothetical protein
MASYDDGLSLGEPVFTVTTPRKPRVRLCTGASGGDAGYAQSAFFGRRPPQHIAGSRLLARAPGHLGPRLAGLPERASGTGPAAAPGKDLTGAAGRRRGAPGIAAARLRVVAGLAALMPGLPDDDQA